MRYRNPKKDSDLFSMIEHQQSVQKTVKGINKLRSRVRVRCEYVFGRMSQMAMDRLRTIGLLRAEQHNDLCNLVYNMDRYAFLFR
jgi:hypothetical protein